MKFVGNESFKSFGHESEGYRYERPFALDEPVADREAAEIGINQDTLHAYVADMLAYAETDESIHPYRLISDLKYEFETAQSGKVVLHSEERLNDEILHMVDRAVNSLEEPSDANDLYPATLNGVVGNNLRRVLEADTKHRYTMSVAVDVAEPDMDWLRDETDRFTSDIKTKVLGRAYFQTEDAIDTVTISLPNSDHCLATLYTNRELSTQELGCLSDIVPDYLDSEIPVTVQDKEQAAFTDITNALMLSDADLEFDTNCAIQM